MSGAREFWMDCRRFLDCLVGKIHQTVYCSSPVSKALYCFCPEPLLDRDNIAVFDLSVKLVGCFGRSGRLSSSEVAVRLSSCPMLSKLSGMGMEGLLPVTSKL